LLANPGRATLTGLAGACLSAVDAVMWPLTWVLLIRHAPQPVALNGPFVTALAVLVGRRRLHRSLWVNHRYWFTT
jgi:hypothetical protein